MPGFGIGMINDDFHIAGIRQVVIERLKRVVMYSIALGPLIVLHSLVRSVFWSMVSTVSIFSVCAYRYGSEWFYSILVVQVR